MTSNDDDDLRLSGDDARFVRKLAEAYRAPEPAAGARARFAAGLEEHLARGDRRRWLGAAATATAAAALVLALLPGGGPVGPAPGDLVAAAPGDVVTAAPAADAPAEDTLLLLTNGPLDDPDEALPEDYQMLAGLLE